MPMVRVSDEDYERLVRLRGELESRTGKPSALGDIFSLMSESSTLTLGIGVIDPRVPKKAADAQKKTREAFKQLVTYAGSASLKKAVDALSTPRPGAIQ